MMTRFDVAANSTLYIPLNTYNSSGASVTISGLAVTDIEIYKNGSVTQRASDAGYTLLDTDGIDFDSITGIHGFSIDLSDNTDAGFFAVGSEYWVVVSSITVDSQTVNYVAAWFRIVAAESVTGKPKVDVDAFGGTAGTFASGRPEVNTSHIAGSAVSTSSAQIGVNVVNAGGTAWGSGAITAASIASDAITAAKIADGAIDAATFAAGAITATVIATDAIDGDAIAATAVTEIQSGLSTLDAAGVRSAVGLASANLDTQLTAIDDYLDTEVAAIKAKTDSLTFTVAGKIDANVTAVKGTTVNGSGTAGDPWGP